MCKLCMYLQIYMSFLLVEDFLYPDSSSLWSSSCCLSWFQTRGLLGRTPREASLRQQNPCHGCHQQLPACHVRRRMGVTSEGVWRAPKRIPWFLHVFASCSSVCNMSHHSWNYHNLAMNMYKSVKILLIMSWIIFYQIHTSKAIHPPKTLSLRPRFRRPSHLWRNLPC